MNWKTIENYPKYEISDCGMVMNSRGWILKPGKHYKGYLEICLSKNGKRKNFKIHRLVAQAFIPNPENKSDVDHINRIRNDNHVSNLRWATQSENGQNRIHQCDNKLGIKNIHYCKTKDRYVYQKMIQGTKVVKYFKTLEEAIQFRTCPHLSDSEYVSEH
jgi:hypothetical protein